MSRTRFWRRLTLVGLLGGTALGAFGGCDEELVLANALPRVTWVDVAPAEDGVAAITVWVRDLEGDPVSLDVTWSAPGGAPTPIAIAPGGHGLVGLTTLEGAGDPNGQPHLISWDVTAVPEGQVTLTFVADDSAAGRTRASSDVAATTVSTPAFPLSTGTDGRVPL